MDEMTWDDLTARLAGFLATMTAPDQQDHLVLNAPGEDAHVDGCAPYAQVVGFDDGEMLRVEVSGNRHLAPAFHLDAQQLNDFRHMGWLGGDDAEPNHYQEVPLASARAVTASIVGALRDDFGVPYPGLLTYEAWGPAATGAGTLGLVSHADVMPEVLPVIGFPDDGAQLKGWVRTTLCERLGPEPTVDDDGDFVLTHLGQPVWVRVHEDAPTVQIMARVVHDVRSRRHTAVEIGLLNRDHAWVKWTLRKHDVWQTLLVPGRPYSAELLNTMLDTFLQAMSLTRDDLALRASGRAA